MSNSLKSSWKLSTCWRLFERSYYVAVDKRTINLIPNEENRPRGVSHIEDQSCTRLDWLNVHYVSESELVHWRSTYENASQPEERREAKAFTNALEPLIQELNHLDSVRLSELEDATNSILGLIDDLWRLDDYKYPQERMERFLSVAGDILLTTRSNLIKSHLNIWIGRLFLWLWYQDWPFGLYWSFLYNRTLS